MWDIQTDQSADYSFTHCAKCVTISRPPMYTHVSLQALIDISTSVPSGIPNGPFVTQDKFGTGKQKSLIIFDPTMGWPYNYWFLFYAKNH